MIIINSDNLILNQLPVLIRNGLDDFQLSKKKMGYHIKHIDRH